MQSCLSWEQGKILEYLCNCVFSCHGAIKFDNSSRSILGMKKRNLGCGLDTRFSSSFFYVHITSQKSFSLEMAQGFKRTALSCLTFIRQGVKKHLGDMKFCLWYKNRTNTNSSLSYFWSLNNNSGTIVTKL